MSKVASIAPKLAERAGKIAYDKRLEAMEQAWRLWRNEVVTALADRVQVAGLKHDDEYELLVMELQHIEVVRDALRWELGVDPHADDRDEEGA